MAPRVIGAWKVHAAIRHRLDGSTVKGIARAAIRAQRETPAAGACVLAQTARIRLVCPTLAIVAMSRSSQLGSCPALVLPRCQLRLADPPPVRGKLVPQPRDGYAVVPAHIRLDNRPRAELGSNRRACPRGIQLACTPRPARP